MKKTNRKFQILLMVLLAMVLMGCASASDKQVAKKNALKYMEEKYGINPTVKSVMGNYQGNTYLPEYTGRCDVNMEYEGISFRVIAPDTEGEYQAAKDNYENQLVKLEMNEHLKMEMGVPKAHCSFIKFQNIDNTFYSFDEHITTSGILDDSENEMTVVIRVYGLDENKFEDIAQKLNSEHKNWNIFIYNFQVEDIYDKHGEDDDSDYIIHNGIDESWLKYYPTYAVGYLKSFAYSYNGETDIIQFWHEKVGELYITYEVGKPVTIELTDQKPTITDEEQHCLTNYYRVSGQDGYRYTISYLKNQKNMSKIGIGFYDPNLKEGEYEFETIYSDLAEKNNIYARTLEVDNTLENRQMFAFFYKK